MVRRGESDDEAAAFRPRAVPWVRALLLNVSLLGLLVGVPFVRGRQRGEESVSAFPPFAACFYGGTARPGGGLAIPAGDREAYATLVLSAPSSWPADCLGRLDAVALPEATFLLPGVKQAEVEVRAGVLTMREEIAALAERRDEDDVVPERPLQAFQRLQAALSTLLLSIDDARGSLDAVTLDAALRLPAPSRIPLRVAEGGSMLTRASPNLLRIVTTDSTRASLVEVDLSMGRVLEGLVRRPRAARATTMDAAHGFLLFITGEATCGDDAASCANRLMGLARIDPRVERPAAEVWVLAHPRGRADRSVRIDGERAWVVARTLEGGAELREFVLAFEDGEGERASAPSEPPDEVVAPATGTEVGGPRPAVRSLVLGDVDVLVSGGAARFLRGRDLVEVDLDALGPERPLATLDIEATRIWACGDWTVAAGALGIEIVLGPSARWTWEIRARPPLALSTPEEEPLALACDEDGLGVTVLDASRSLAVALCTPEGCRFGALGSGVADGAAITFEGSETHVASWRLDGAIVLRSFSRTATDFLADGRSVAACWERGRGFCGPARFVAGGPRPLLLARDGTDVSVLEHDETWRPLPGLGTALAPVSVPAD